MIYNMCIEAFGCFPKETNRIIFKSSPLENDRPHNPYP